MDNENDYIKSRKRNKINSKLVHQQVSENISKLTDSGIHRNYYHYLVPGFNMAAEDVYPNNLKITPNFQCLVPRNLYVSTNVADKTELCFRRVVMYHGFAYKIRYNASVYDNYLKKKSYRKAVKRGIYPTAVVRCANLISTYPYPFFSGEYDWYFTGGNMTCMNNFLLSARGVNMNTINISVVKSKRLKNITDIEYQSCDVNAPTSEILEIQASKDLKNRFFVRYEKNIAKYFFDGSETTLLCNIRRPIVPFITLSDDPFNENIIITGDLNRQICLWDVNRSTETPFSILLSQKDEILERPDNWNCIRHFNTNSFVYTDFEKFSLIDKQIESFVDDIDFLVFKDQIGICEKISSLAVSSRFSNLIYLGTTHKIYALDVRYMKKKSGKLVLLKWTHQMKYPPLILKIHNYFESEIIAASSPLYGEICLFEVKKSLNECSKRILTSPYLPVSPPDLVDSFYFAKLQGECLSPVVDFQSRIKRCITGVDFFEKNNKLQLITANSLGDVFSSKIVEEIEDSKIFHTEAVKNYYEAIQNMSKQDSKELHVTNLKDMSNICKIFRSARLDPEIKTESTEHLIENFPLKKQKLSKWEKMPTQYAECKDVLAGTILKIWDFDIDKTELLVKSSNISKEEKICRTEDWIENIKKNYYKNNKFIGETLEDEANLINDKSSNINDKLFKKTSNDHLEADNENNYENIKKSYYKNNKLVDESFESETDLNIDKSCYINDRSFQEAPNDSIVIDNENAYEFNTQNNFKLHTDKFPRMIPRNISNQVNKSKKVNANKRKREYIQGF